MGSVVVIMVIIGCAGLIVWRWQRRWRMNSAPVPPGEISRETLALRAFMHGNTCLAAGELADARAAFQQARELDPKRAHVAERLAEVERRQRAVSTPPPVTV